MSAFIAPPVPRRLGLDYARAVDPRWRSERRAPSWRRSAVAPCASAAAAPTRPRRSTSGPPPAAGASPPALPRPRARGVRNPRPAQVRRPAQLEDEHGLRLRRPRDLLRLHGLHVCGHRGATNRAQARHPLELLVQGGAPRRGLGALSRPALRGARRVTRLSFHSRGGTERPGPRRPHRGPRNWVSLTAARGTRRPNALLGGSPPATARSRGGRATGAGALLLRRGKEDIITAS